LLFEDVEQGIFEDMNEFLGDLMEAGDVFGDGKADGMDIILDFF